MRGKTKPTGKERRRKASNTGPGVTYCLCFPSPMAATFIAHDMECAVRNPPTIAQRPRVLFHRAAACGRVAQGPGEAAFHDAVLRYLGMACPGAVAELRRLPPVRAGHRDQPEARHAEDTKCTEPRGPAEAAVAGARPCGGGRRVVGGRGARRARGPGRPVSRKTSPPRCGGEAPR